MYLNLQLIAIIENTVDLFFRGLSFLIVLRILLSWLAPGARGQLSFFIFSVTEPVLGFFRRLPLRVGLFDLSPIVALFALDFARVILLRFLFAIF